jgi:predicted AlkP superfamily pyrophosphatase or phosphodiesterase
MTQHITRAVQICFWLSCLMMPAISPSLLLAADRPHLLVISIDGMGADYVTKADEHGLKIPTLRRFLKEGTYADGVVGVIPTMTYPSHMTMATGVWPSEHGVYNNQKFDPLGKLHGAVYTDASDLKVETLWQAAHDAGYVTASVGWPVTTGATGIDYLMPANGTFEGRSADGEAVEKAAPDVHFDHPAGLREILAADVPRNSDISIDARRFAWTTAILRRYRPGFMTTHLGELDHAEHTTGPFSRESAEAIEMLDGQVAELVRLERTIDPNAYIVVVSDHGFEPVEKTINLRMLFSKAGLMETTVVDGVSLWNEALWLSGGTAAIVLHDSSNSALRERVLRVLKDAAKNLEYGIAYILQHEEVVKRGGFPDASFVVELQPGFKFGNAKKGEVVTASPHTGTHGFLPKRPELYASFLMLGPDVASGRDLGLVDMRQIAPTLASVLGVKLSAAKQTALRYNR